MGKKKNAGLRRLLVLALVLGVGALLFGRTIQRHILQYAVLHAEGADEEAVQELIKTAPDPAAMMRRLWETRKIPHRLLVLEYLKTAATTQPELCRELRPLLVAAALDADLDARERALGVLDVQKDAQLADLARLQLRDADPQARLLGLRELRRAGDARLVPEMMGMLADPEPVVAASAEALLRTWTSNDFGLRIHMTVSDSTSGSTTSRLEPGKAAALSEAVKKWQDWWQLNQSNYAAVPPIAADIPSRTQPLSAGDFALKDLSGHRVQLSDYKGRTVFLNFWATWCTACLLETPDLVELQKQHSKDVVLLAVCLDGRPERDEDDDHETKDHGSASNPAAPALSRDEIKKKVERIVDKQRINYQVLLNPTGEIGARFNGGELPTNLILSPDGQIRRRFVGTRSVAALERMLQEAAHAGATPD